MSTFYIASLKHTHRFHEHITWWARFHCGYTPVVGPEIGAYCYGEACDLNDGRDCIAVPAEAVQKLLSPEPYFKPGGRFYDQRGPVVENTKANWGALVNARLSTEGENFKPKPGLFRGKRRSLYFIEHEECSVNSNIPAAGEALTRFCPGCGSVGPVPAIYRDCCPDGGDARLIPEPLALKCRDLFKLALDAAAAPAMTEDQRRERFNAWFAQQPMPELLARMDPQQAAHNAFEHGFALALPVSKS